MLTTLKNYAVAAFNKILAALVGILLFSYFGSLGLGLFLFYGLPQGVDTASRQIAELPLSAFMIVNFRIPLGVSVGSFFLVMWILYVSAFVLAWFDKPSFPSSFRNFVTRFDLTHSNYLAVLPQLASAVLVAVVVLQRLQESAGVQTGAISFESPMLGFLAVSYAPFVEEFSYRITTIGLLDGLHLLWKMRRLPPDQERKSTLHVLILTVWKPERAKELLRFNTIRNNGVRRGISRFEWPVLVLTSGAFGAVHYLSGGGWEVGKISTAMLTGVAMGFVYLRYGAYAPFLLHWFFNYYFGAFDLASTVKLAGSDLVVLGVELLNIATGTMVAVVLIAVCLVRSRSLRRQRAQIRRDSVSGFSNAS